MATDRDAASGGRTDAGQQGGGAGGSIDAGALDAATMSVVDSGSTWVEPDPPIRTPPQCGGFASSCSTLSTATCTTALGCSLGGSCSGIVHSCYSEIYSSGCYDIDGCFWSSVYSDCTGVARSCSSFISAFTCDGQPGCFWQDECEGTVTACENVTGVLCDLQPGCSVSCEFPLVLCDGSCVDITDDEGHCGGCGIDCGTRARCTNGLCECGAPSELCDGRCVDVTSDGNHCGGCNMPCGAGHVCLDRACVDVDECATLSPCSNGRVCTNTAGGYECGPCPDGFQASGPAACVDIDECIVGNGGCDPHSTCLNATGSFSCSACLAGYEGDGSTGCTDIDECDLGTDDCDALTDCMNQDGTYTCTACPAGYSGTGRTGCTDIDECDTNNGGCDPLAPCTNLPGSASCGACPSGYTGDGDSGCADIDECMTNNGGCDLLVTCTNNVGAAPTCGACPAGYAGSGQSGCSPALTSLVLSSGVLSPALSVNVTTYTVGLALTTQTITLTPTVVAGATISINGEPITSGMPWESDVLDLGPNAIEIVVSQSDHPSTNYTITVTRGHQEAYLKASNTQYGDFFGWRVAIDGNTLVVGAYLEDSNATGVNGNQTDNSVADSGAAYVFVRNGSTWSQQAYLKASNPGTTDYFGSRVAISGNTVAVSASNEDSAATGVNGNQTSEGAMNSGAVYVFVRSGSTWSQQAYVKASNTGMNDAFGQGLALDGNTLVAGAYFEASNATGIDGNQADNSAVRAGAAYVFTRSGSTWSQQAYLKASNAEAEDAFGYAVAVSGDTVVVGAQREASNATGIDGDQANNGRTDSGAVYVFTRSDTTWSQQAYLKASNAGANDLFGWDVALSTDTLVVAALQEDSSATGIDGDGADNGAPDSGAVYVFTRSDTTWSQQAYLKASNTDTDDSFGRNVAISGDTVIVGAVYEDGNATGINGNQADNNATDSGAAYVFTRNGSTWMQELYLKADNAEPDDSFGVDVAVSGDTFVVGAIYEDSGATGVNGDQTDNSVLFSGATYVFR